MVLPSRNGEPTGHRAGLDFKSGVSRFRVWYRCRASEVMKARMSWNRGEPRNVEHSGRSAPGHSGPINRVEMIDGIRNISRMANPTWVPLRYAAERARRRSRNCGDPPRGANCELPLVGSRHELNADAVRQVCEALGLNGSDLPGPRSTA